MNRGFNKSIFMPNSETLALTHVTSLILVLEFYIENYFRIKLKLFLQ